jgi:THO complex subunit 2
MSSKQETTKDVEMVDAEEELHRKRCALLAEVNTETYEWEHLTEQALTKFEDAKTDIVARSSIESSSSDSIFYEIFLCAKFYPERLSTVKLVNLLDEMMDEEYVDVLKGRFVAMLNTFKFDSALADLLKACRKLPCQYIACFALEDEVITRLDMIRSYGKEKTDYLIRNLVDQKRFLLHESSEGYAKVMTILSDACASEFSKYEIPTVNKAVETCIGHFNLDPLLVLDIIISLGAEYSKQNYRFWLDLLEQSQWWPKGLPANPNSLETLNKGGNEDASRLIASRFNVIGKEIFPELHVDRRIQALATFTSMLMKRGFISFGSILKQLGPDEETMSKLSEEINDSIEQEIFKASANALALSGPLVDEDEDGESKPSTAPEQTKLTEAEKFNYKMEFLKSTLSNGLYYPSLYLLNKYPSLAFAEDQIPQLIIRMFTEMMKPLIQALKPLPDEQLKKLLSPLDAESYHKNKPKFFEMESVLGYEKENDVYFYYDWVTDLPQIENTTDLIKYSNEFLSFIGARLGGDAVLLSSLCKLAVQDLIGIENNPQHDEKLNQWFEYFRKFILPASSYGHENPIAVYDTFQLLKLFPLQWRYNLYGELQKVTSKNNQFVRLNYSKAEKQTKDVLKRLTTENVKQTMRRLSKITFANPVPAFSVITSQVESYDNLTDLVVDAARYFTDYAWDVLPFVLLTRLTQRREAIQADGVNDAFWLQSLSTFIAKLARTYSSFNLIPILQFTLRALHQRNGVGLTLFKQLVAQMGGIQRFTNLVPNQIKFLSYSPSLQKVARKVIMDTRDTSRRSGERLLNALSSAGMLTEMFVLLYDFHKSVLNNCDDDIPFKVITDRSDESAAVLHTFSQLLNFFAADIPELFQQNITPVPDLVSKYNVGICWAFELWRSHIPLEQELNVDFRAVDFTNFSKQLYSDFWKLGLYDINFDATVYEAELIKLETQNKTIANEIRISNMDSRERNDKDNIKLRKKLEANSAFNNQIMKTLPFDQEKHKSHSDSVSKVLEGRRSSWFSSESPSDAELEAFVQFCIVPRLLHSETDAVFVGFFITTQLPTEISKFVLDKIFGSSILGTLIYTATPIEAENIGLFVAEVIGKYEKEESSNEMKKSSFYWLKKLIPAVKSNLLHSENYMTRRNTLTFLKNLIPVVRVKSIGSVFHAIIEDVSKTETRDDLKLASSAVFALLQSASKSWKDVWEVVDFDHEEKKAIEDKTLKFMKRRQLLKDEEKRAALKKAEKDLAERKAAMEAKEARRAAIRAEEDAARLKEEEEKAAAEAKAKEEHDQISDNEENDSSEEDSDGDIVLEEDDEPENRKPETKATSGAAVLFEPTEEESTKKDFVKFAKEQEVKKNTLEDKNSKVSAIQKVPDSSERDDRSKSAEILEGKTKTDNRTSIRRDDRNNRGSENRPPSAPRFQNVTGSQLPLTRRELDQKMDRLSEQLRKGNLEGLIQMTSDHPLTSKRLRENDDRNRSYRNNLKTILAEYIRSFSDSPDLISMKRFGPHIGTFPITPYQPPPPRSGKRAPLPAQSAVVSSAINVSHNSSDSVNARTADREGRDQRDSRSQIDRRATRNDHDRREEKKDRQDGRNTRDSRDIRDDRDRRDRRDARDSRDVRPPPPPPPPAGSRNYDRKRSRHDEYPEKRRRY